MSGMLVMCMMVSAVGGELPHSSDTCFLYPRELGGELPEMAAGTYAVWIYAAQNVDSFVEAQGVRYELKPERRKDRNDEQAWKRLGEVDVRRSGLELSCGENISMIALSKKKAFHPDKALAHMRALPLPDAVRDMRAERQRGTNTVFTMPRYELASWEATADTLRDRILLGCGLYPLPEKTPLKANVFDETEQDGYKVAKVHFEAWPGFLVTGNLYRPLDDGVYPGIVCPHGHWGNGRLEDSEKGSVPARCITLARMGAVAFSYDMIGYVDSKQTNHGWGGKREKLWGVHAFAMQLWSSIRAVDFVSGLPYVDTDRIGCTGASGGGTQTFALTAVDDRIKVTVPVNMISSTMQGGCGCENAPILRLGNSNMEIGALAAPRPMLMVSATGDWTRETPRVEYPAIKSIYALYGAADNVENVHLDYGHNYNQASREAMYRFMGKHLIGGDWDDFTEPAYTKPDDAVLRVFPGEAPPEGYLNGDDLVQSLVQEAKTRRAARIPKSKAEAAQWKEQHGNAFSRMLGAETPKVNNLDSTRHDMKEMPEYVLEHWVLGRADAGDRIPAIFYRNNEAAKQDAVIVVHGRGKAFLADIDNESPGELVTSLLEKGKAVLLIDTYLVGEHHEPAQKRRPSNIGQFHDTFHPTDTGCRVQDILTAYAFLMARYDMTGIIDLVGMDQAGIWALLAGAVEPGFRRITVDMNQFDATDDKDWKNTYYVPGIRALGDVPAALAIGGVDRFTLYNAVTSEELNAISVNSTTAGVMPALP